MIALIAIDWGSTSFRAWALDRQGAVLAQTEAGQGILALAPEQFEPCFEAALGAWLDDAPPVIAAGMITSRNGWCETPYLPLPLDAGALARGLVPHRTKAGRLIHFVCGAICDPQGAFPDVMRGEETEVIGQIASRDAAAQDGLYVLPGTHSKWVRVAEGRIMDFQTCMTGEAFAMLRAHSILGRLIEAGPADPMAFLRGVQAAKRPGAFWAKAFSARSLALVQSLPPAAISDYLSGLLIGDEIRGRLEADLAPHKVTIIGRGDLASRYASACQAFGLQAEIAAEGMNRRGLFEIAQGGGLLG